jgi:hypothetical protein
MSSGENTPMPEAFVIPESESNPDIDTWGWYCNVLKELEAGFLTPEEKLCLVRYYQDAGLLSNSRWRYFRQHFSRTFDKAVRFLSARKTDGVTLDLGAGCGTQSIYLALVGSRVIALDMDERALTVLRKRKQFYENLIRRPLLITILRTNALEFDYSRIAPIGSVHSMFAFNMMQPSAKLLDTLQPHFGSKARIAVLDGNHGCLFKRMLGRSRRTVWTPSRFRDEIERRGFEVRSHLGGVAIPPLMWQFAPERCIAVVNRILNTTWSFPVSHQILAERKE